MTLAFAYMYIKSIHIVTTSRIYSSTFIMNQDVWNVIFQ